MDTNDAYYIALICERTLTFVYIFGPTFYLDLLTGFMAMGIILVTFASTFIALYWYEYTKLIICSL
jgi:hypothetical protein